jgi:hypothetical protein
MELDVTTTEPLVTTQVFPADPVMTVEIVDGDQPRRH